MKHKNKRVSAEDLDEVIASHFGNFDTVEADEDEDLEGDDEEMLEDEEDILDDAEGDEESDEDSDESEDDEDFEGDDEEEEVTDEDDEDFEGDDEGDDDEADADDEFEGEGDDEEEDFLDVDGEDEDSEDDDEDFDAEADEDEDFEDIDAVIASAEDPIEALIACGAVAVIMPTASHDFQEVKAAFDGLDEEFEADASDDEDFEDADEDFEADADEDSEDEDFEVEADDDESCDDDDEVLEDEDEEEIDDEADASEDDEDDDFEADASDDEDSDESEDEDDEVTADDEDSEVEDSENFHPVADMEMLAEASAEDVELVLYAQGSDAWWNVIVAGLPAARISKESLSPEVHAFFVQDQFASNVKETIASEGLLPVLENMHAEFYATAFLNSELADEIRSEVEATASEDVTERAANLREDFLKAVNLASAGCNKNYWPKLGSPLKAALFEELAEAGVSNAAEIIENAFAKGGDAHFDAVTSKAVEIMDKSPEYREELEEAIAEAGVISHASDESDEEEIEESSNTATASFMQKLVHGSFGNKSSKGSLGDRLRNGLGR